MGKDLYSIKDLTDFIIKEYKLDTSSPDYYDNYYQKIYRALHETGIYERAIIEENPKTNRKGRFFTEEQKKELLDSETIYYYVGKNSKSDSIKKRQKFKKLQKEIRERRRAEISLMEFHSQQQKDGEYITTPDIDSEPFNDEEYKAIKRDMMLTALFEKYFTEIRDDLLKKDLARVYCENIFHLEREDILARDRLDHPEGHYYRKRTRSKKDESN